MTRIEKAIARRPDDTNALFLGAAILAELGQADRAREWADRVSLLAPEDALGHYNLCCAFALLGDRERAIELLERACRAKHPQFVVWIKNDSDLDGLRDHPRYQALVQLLEAKAAEAESQSTGETGAQPSGV
jgi:adenylate cyclase